MFDKEKKVKKLFFARQFLNYHYHKSLKIKLKDLNIKSKQATNGSTYKEHTHVFKEDIHWELRQEFPLPFLLVVDMTLTCAMTVCSRSKNAHPQILLKIFIKSRVSCGRQLMACEFKAFKIWNMTTHDKSKEKLLNEHNQGFSMMWQTKQDTLECEINKCTLT